MNSEKYLQLIADFQESADKSPEFFNQIIWDFYYENRRPFAWRDVITPYHVFVSEVMLQQTQTHRVIPKFEDFITHFDSFQALADAPFVEVLTQWKGLGYNRRAKYLQEAAKMIVYQHGGTLPAAPDELVKLPGIGPATAASIATFAYNAPHIFIETNIRSVFLLLFFHEQENVSDTMLLPLIDACLDREKPRDWYYALMDFGVFIKKYIGNPNKKSRHYTKQKSFKGSNRQIRGKILEILLNESPQTKKQIYKQLPDFETERIDKNLDDLCAEQLITQQNRQFMIQ
jgi:A/G-specific adenine glycosylase